MIRNIAALGAGTIGHSAAEHFAIHGYHVRLYDPSEAACERAKIAMQSELAVFEEEGLLPLGGSAGVLARIEWMPTLEQAVLGADYVLESVDEDLELKRRIFCRLEEICPPHALFGTNTSSLQLAEITRDMGESGKARSMMCHWFNPGHIIPLVELSFYGNMSEEDYAKVDALYRRVEKRPVKVLKDVPGLAANRMQHAVAREVFWLLGQGVAEAQDLEDALRFGPAFRYATMGQLTVADLNGLDVYCRVENNLLPTMDASIRANPVMQKLVDEGKLGFKTGEGFFTYPEDQKEEMRRVFNRRLIRQLKASSEYE